MAGAGYKLFNTGDVLTAAQVNTYLQEQTVMVFANATARTTALSGVLAEGMMSYLQDTNAVEVYNGSSWVNVGNAGDITEVQAGTGISVASGTGPIPVITSTVATTFDAKGDLVVGTGSDTFARLAVGGTNGHVLQVDSGETTGLKWAAPAGGGALKFISRTTFSNVATQDFDSVFTSTYKAYKVVIENISAATTTDDLYLRLRYAGSTQASGFYQSVGKYAAGSTVAITSGAGNEVVFADSAGSSAEPSSYVFYIYGVGNTSETARGHFTGYNSNNTYVVYGGFLSSTSRTYDGFRLLSSSTNISGTVSIYGLATA